MSIDLTAPATSSRAATLAKFSVLLAVILLLNTGGAWLAAQANVQIWPEHLEIIELMWVTMAVAYVALMTIPFVPGIEVGLVLMLMPGDGGILLIYLATQLALSISFWLGHLVPPDRLARALSFFGLGRMAGLLLQSQSVMCGQRAQWLGQHFDSPVGRWLMNHQSTSLAILINLPGNSFIGGAGGIGILVGSTGLICYRRFVLVMAVATAPLPLALAIFDWAG